MLFDRDGCDGLVDEDGVTKAEAMIVDPAMKKVWEHYYPELARRELVSHGRNALYTHQDPNELDDALYLIIEQDKRFDQSRAFLAHKIPGGRPSKAPHFPADQMRFDYRHAQQEGMADNCVRALEG